MDDANSFSLDGLFDSLPLSEADRARIRYQDDKDAFRRACFEGDLETVQAMRAGADLNSRGPFGCTSLLYAASQGCEEVVRYLLSDKKTSYIRVNQPNDDGITPLMAACDCRAWNCALVLLEEGAQPNQSSTMGWTARDFIQLSSAHEFDPVARKVLKMCPK
jgi:ankyrin repeat protein